MPSDEERKFADSYEQEAKELAGFPGSGADMHLCALLRLAWSREAALKTQISELEVMASPTLYFYNWRKAGSTIRRLRRRWQWERRRAKRFRVDRDLARHAEMSWSGIACKATAERDAARAAVAQMVEAWESVDGCPRNTMLEIATEYTARYPREKREEAGR